MDRRNALKFCAASAVMPLIGRVSARRALGSPILSIKGPLVQSATNPRWLVNSTTGKAVGLYGSHTWNSLQDGDNGGSYPPTQALDFNYLCGVLQSMGHNCTILWRKDLPQSFGWGAGGTWRWAPWPWARTGPGTATDGQPKFDLTTFDNAFFNRLYARAYQLWQCNMYAIVELFDGLDLANNRGSTDGYPFTGVNNINSVDDGYVSGTSGTASMTMTSANAITAAQDAMVQKFIDVLNPLPNIIWEIAEEWPASSWWISHMISLVQSYEAGKPYQHPILLPTSQFPGNDSTLVNFNQAIIAPIAKVNATSYSGTGTPAAKVPLNDSDHSYFGMWNDSNQVNRNSWAWPNFCRGSVIFMDPGDIAWTSRNSPPNVVNGVGSAFDTRWNLLRQNLGQMAKFATSASNLQAMSPNDALVSSPCNCLANTSSGLWEYFVYCPNAASSGFTVDLTGNAHTFSLTWYDCATNTISNGGTVSGGAVRTLTGSSSLDMAAYLKDTGA